MIEAKKESLTLEIFDDSNFVYLIDRILGGLNPQFACQYPC